MRGFLASSIGVTCAAALALPLTLSSDPATARPELPDRSSSRAVPAGMPYGRTGDRSGDRTDDVPGDVPGDVRSGKADTMPGSTQSLALGPLGTPGSPGAPRALGRGHATNGAVEEGLTRRRTHTFSMVGVVWNDPAGPPPGRVEVRTRDASTGQWSGWRRLETDSQEHGPDGGTEEAGSAGVRGATAPLWVGPSDGVETRVVPATDAGGTRAVRALPEGLRVELVDPGEGTGTEAGGNAGGKAEASGGTRVASVSGARARAEEADAEEVNADLDGAEADEIPALGRTATEREFERLSRAGETGVDDGVAGLRARPYIGPRPRIVTRWGWGADESLRRGGFVYNKRIKAVFVHHTVSGNKYSCAEAPALVRGIYRYHVRSMGWRDIGYNFLVDKCGTIYEGRAGGVARPVQGAHTRGFNGASMGVAVIGTFSRSKPSSAAVRAVARLSAWKLGLYGVDPEGRTTLRSAGGGLYRKGKNVRMHVISGHRDGFLTDCPGRRLYNKLGKARATSAWYQGR